jgi:acetyl esterase/lipase
MFPLLHPDMIAAMIREDVVVGAVEGRQLHVDVFEPMGEVDHSTAVVQLHPGSWRAGDRKWLRPHSERLAALGFTALSAEYRLVGEAAYPACLNDVSQAIAWAREHYGRVALQGFSAGAHLSLMAAGTGAPVGAVIALYPPAAITLAADFDSEGNAPAVMLLGDGATADAAREASPLTYVSSRFPPVLLVHGTADTLVASRSSIRLYDALREAGVTTELHLVAGVDHAFDISPSYGDLVAYETAFFLRRTLVETDRERIAAETLSFAEILARQQPAAVPVQP